MKAKLALAVAVLQVLVLAFMAGQREWILRFGAPLVLRTAPLDPNDPMRGAYVRLNYEVSFVPASLCRGEVAKWFDPKPAYGRVGLDYRASQKLRDRVVYATLKSNPSGLVELDSLSDTAPASGSFLRGRVVNVSESGVQVRYGIEALFMNKQAAQTMERDGFARAGAPMNVTVAVGSSGIAVLKDTAWEPLGITLAFDRVPRPQQRPGQPWQQPPGLAGLTVTLHNYGDKPVAIVNLPDGGSFRLVPNERWGNSHYRWVGRPDADSRADANLVVLKPGETRDTHLDLTQPQWWVVDTSKPGAEPIPLQKIPQQDVWNASFRVEYAPPPAEMIRSLPNADLVRHAPLRSRAFNANQGVD